MEVQGLNPNASNLRTNLREKLLQNIISMDDQDWGKKILITDPVTMLTIDSAIEMNELTLAGIADVVDIDVARLPLPQLEAIYFISPTDKNVSRIIEDFVDLMAPPYKKISIYFSSTPTTDMLKRLGQSKVAGRIVNCKIADVNFLVYDSHTFHFGTPVSFWNLFSKNSQNNQVSDEMDAIADKLCSVAVTFEDFPVIRFASNSPFAGRISQIVHQKLTERFTKGLIKKNQQRGQLLILDRTHDLISPIIHELYYQAMVQDLIRPPNDVYKCPYKDANGYDQKYVVILNENDPIFVSTRHLHIKKAREWIVSNVKMFTEQSKALQSSGDISKIARSMPHYQLMKTKYSVHSSLSKKCFDDYGALQLERITGAEQCMATGQTEEGNKVGIPQELSGLIRGNDIRTTDKLRLLMLLYASDPDTIRKREQFELNSGLSHTEQVISQEWCRIVDLSGRRNQRRPPAHDTEWQFLTSRFLPAIYDIIKSICSGNLSTQEFTFEDRSESNVPFTAGPTGRSKRSSVMPGFGVTNLAQQAKQPALYVFIAGGISYSEIRIVHELSKELGRDIIIGSTHIVSPLDLLDQVGSLAHGPDAQCYQSSYIGDQDYFS